MTDGFYCWNRRRPCVLANQESLRQLCIYVYTVILYIYIPILYINTFTLICIFVCVKNQTKTKEKKNLRKKRMSTLSSLLCNTPVPQLPNWVNHLPIPLHQYNYELLLERYFIHNMLKYGIFSLNQYAPTGVLCWDFDINLYFLFFVSGQYIWV